MTRNIERMPDRDPVDGDEEFIKAEFRQAAQAPVEEASRIAQAGMAAGRTLRSHRRMRHAVSAVVVVGLLTGGSLALRPRPPQTAACLR